MADNIQEEINHHDIKQWQHCSLFNLDLFNDEHHNLNINKDNNINIDECCCSLSTPNVDDQFSKKHLDHSCPFNVLQKNYTTQLEHVAEKLLSNNDNNTLDNCYYCSTYETNDTKVQSINRKILLGSTVIFDNFLRNNLKTSLLINSNNPSSTTTTTIINGNNNNNNNNNPRRWHSERGSRHSNVRANLPLTTAQRQVLERYMNYPIIKPPTNIRSIHRSHHHHHHHHHQPIIGKVVENTGTALSTLTEQPLNTTNSINTISHIRKNSAASNNTHIRPILSNASSISTASHRHCFLVDTIVHNKSKDDSKNNNENEFISSEFDHIDDKESNIELNQISILSNHPLNLTEILSECTICCELKRLQKRTCCNFYVCSTCLNIYVEQQIKQGIIRIQCPNRQCHIYMHRDEIHKRCISPELRHKFTRILIDNNRLINIKTCPRCSNIHEIDVEICRSMKRAPTKVQCVECNLIWCFQCHSPWHDGIQCKEFRRGDRMLKKWAREVHYGQHNAQQCPCCKVYIQRTKGCDHIVCLRCKTEFCYKCGDRFRDIKFIGDHYSELSVLGCKYRFYPDNPLKRRLIRGSILGGKILAAPIILCLAAVAGAVCASIGFPAYCCFMLVRQIKASRRKHRHATLKEPVLMGYKTLNDMVPQLIPRDPVNMNSIKSRFNSIRSNIQNNIDINTISNAPIAVFDECDIHIPTNQKDELMTSPISSSSSPNFPRLISYSTLRTSISKKNE
ncbi:unnamed protein product [Rotaria sordida]|uniref:RBR-type E3 ubiquitin transferase n=2 Tax=Rotaria sordida TaxID=392033 RepID=A0A814XWP4_9BILA|nr:unnamed protein product [Rotaria sordida]CAF1221430.1 unnamed protein product [Rotaria sordida]CAF3500098.1 unnamed protein product [Rotaria sordida]